jgi:hypothetical protein
MRKTITSLVNVPPCFPFETQLIEQILRMHHLNAPMVAKTHTQCCPIINKERKLWDYCSKGTSANNKTTDRKNVRRKKNNDCWHCHSSKHPNKLKCKDCKGIGHRSSASKRRSLCEKHQANLAIGRHDDDFAQFTSFAFATKRKEPESNDSEGQNEKKENCAFIE